MRKEQDILDFTINKLLEKALKDGIITVEEKKLMDEVTLTTEAYTKLLEESLEDGIITEEEGRKLEEFKRNIIKRAEEVAKEDGKITEEESELIKQLSQLISRYYKTY